MIPTKYFPRTAAYFLVIVTGICSAQQSDKGYYQLRKALQDHQAKITDISLNSTGYDANLGSIAFRIASIAITKYSHLADLERLHVGMVDAADKRMVLQSVEKLRGEMKWDCTFDANDLRAFITSTRNGQMAVELNELKKTLSLACEQFKQT